MKGYTKSCPNRDCRKIVLRYCTVRGHGIMQLKCPHCHELVEVKFELEPVVRVGKVIPLIILAILAVSTIGVIVFYPINTQEFACVTQK